MWVPYQFLLVPSINYITKTINDFSCDLVINFSYSQWTHKWWKISFAKKPRKSTVSLINSPWATELSKRETAPGLSPQPRSLLVTSENSCFFIDFDSRLRSEALLKFEGSRYVITLQRPLRTTTRYTRLASMWNHPASWKRSPERVRQHVKRSNVALKCCLNVGQPSM